MSLEAVIAAASWSVMSDFCASVAVVVPLQSDTEVRVRRLDSQTREHLTGVQGDTPVLLGCEDVALDVSRAEAVHVRVFAEREINGRGHCYFTVAQAQRRGADQAHLDDSLTGGSSTLHARRRSFTAQFAAAGEARAEARIEERARYRILCGGLAVEVDARFDEAVLRQSSASSLSSKASLPGSKARSRGCDELADSGDQASPKYPGFLIPSLAAADPHPTDSAPDTAGSPPPTDPRRCAPRRT